MKKLFQIPIVLLLLSLQSKAQSYHFSQFYSTPLWNNPAFTGYTDGPYRVAANFRSQWLQGGSPYLTSSLTADFSLMREKLADGNRLGAGIAFMNDQSLNGALQTNTIGYSMAYHLSLDADNIHHLGLGLQGTFHQRRIDYSKLTFENQYDGGGYNPSIPVAESFTSGTKRYFDMNTGLLYNYSYDYSSFFISLGVFNVLQHKENVLVPDYKVPVRYTALASGQQEVSESSLLYYSLNYMRQGSANEITLGAAYGITISDGKEQELVLGLWHRVKDALIPYIGYRVNGLQAGLSYDYTISTAKTGSMARNSFELSFVYQRPDNSDLKRLIPWY
jgi:type IX secretion system PorP/SprF family membrane protein